MKKRRRQQIDTSKRELATSYGTTLEALNELRKAIEELDLSVAFFRTRLFTYNLFLDCNKGACTRPHGKSKFLSYRWSLWVMDKNLETCLPSHQARIFILLNAQ